MTAERRAGAALLVAALVVLGPAGPAGPAGPLAAAAAATAPPSSPTPGAPSPAPPEAARVWHRRPVRAPVVDRFRLPDGPFGAGNRGWEHATPPGTPVRATAPGTVTFAGQVAGNLHVSVLHADGVRSTYSYLASLSVVAGQVVAAGQLVGRSTHRFQVGFLRGDTYLDPASRFVPLVVRLVPDARFEAAASRAPPPTPRRAVAGG
jgi:murein DD-endopeptidase MepM/ murein hydrolase activator NlpD